MQVSVSVHFYRYRYQIMISVSDDFGIGRTLVINMFNRFLASNHNDVKNETIKPITLYQSQRSLLAVIFLRIKHVVDVCHCSSSTRPLGDVLLQEPQTQQP